MGGKAIFNYTAPNDIRGLTSTTATISFTDEFDQTITQVIEIRFEGANNYNLINVSTPVIINKSAQRAEISAYLVDQYGNPVEGEPVNITPPANGYGTITPGISTTDAAGKAAFMYEAPDNLAGLSSTTVTISYVNGAETISKNVEIQIVGGGYTGYQLVNAKNPYYIYSPTQPDTFDIQLIKDGFPVVGMAACASAADTNCVLPDAIDRRFGRFDAENVSDGYGYLHFKYIAPNPDEKAANGEDTTFTVVYIDENGMIAAESEPVSLRMRY